MEKPDFQEFPMEDHEVIVPFRPYILDGKIKVIEEKTTVKEYKEQHNVQEIMIANFWGRLQWMKE